MVALVLGLAAFNSGIAFASNEMSGFHFQTCDTAQCMDMTSSHAAVSHIDFGFTTLDRTELKLTDLKGHLIRTITVTAGTYYPSIATVTIDDEINHKSYVISLRTNRIQEFGAPVEGAKK